MGFEALDRRSLGGQGFMSGSVLLAMRRPNSEYGITSTWSQSLPCAVQGRIPASHVKQERFTGHD